MPTTKIAYPNPSIRLVCHSKNRHIGFEPKFNASIVLPALFFFFFSVLGECSEKEDEWLF